MINAALVGCEIASLLPENETPAHTEGREGFYHLTDFSGDIAHAKVNYIVRDHDKATFEKRLDTLRGIEKKMNEKYHADTVKLNIQHSYSNMLEVIEKNEYVVAIAKKAIKNVGLEPVSRPVRGGTDGARLSFMGLPCPNLGTGGYGFHGPFEHISVEEEKLGLKGSPTRVWKSFTKGAKAAGKVFEVEPAEAADIIVEKLKEKFII